MNADMRGGWHWTRRLTKRAGLAGVVLLAIILVASLAPFVAPYDPIAQPDIIAMKNLAPSLAHPFGTDSYSRDVLSRSMYGARISLTVAALATVIAVTFGTLYGAVSGYAGGAIDTAMMRFVDAALAIPRVLLLIAILALWNGLSLWLLVVILGVTGWFGLSRMVRAQVLAIRELDFVAAARALGASGPRILLRHILPNVVPTIIVAATLGIGHVIILEAGLSYLGLGVQPPTASWGSIIQDGADQVGTSWWISLFPGLLIVTTAIACNSLGDAISLAFDPRHRAASMRELDS
ncbi:MAG: ABC transporter permease [Gemmatimonadota bacterium]|nr:ABC transporter permease [Gemmatimonadota bacterium]